MDSKKAYKYALNEVRANEKKRNTFFNTPVEKLLNEDRVFGPIKLSTTGQLVAFEGAGFYTKFRPGDRAQLATLDSKHCMLPAGESIIIKAVEYPEYGKIRIEATKKNGSISPHQEFWLIPEFNNSLNRLIVKFISQIAPYQLDEHNRGLKNRSWEINISQTVSASLNSEQLSCVLDIVGNNFKGCIKGPPGTGKTQTLLALIELAHKNKLKIGLTGYTHNAVNNAVKRIAKILPEIKILRIFPTSSNNSSINDLSGLPSVSATMGFSEDTHTSSFDLFAATTHSWILSKQTPYVDVMIVDEAGQIPSFFLEPLKTKCHSLIALGDNKQLPPTLTSQSIPEEERDLFSVLLQEAKVDLRLETQYRMNSEIQDWSANRYYDGRLRPHESVATRDILKGHPSAQFFSQSVQFYKARDSADSAAKTVSLVKTLLHIGVPINEIGIIGAHRVELAKVNEQIQRTFGNKLLTDLKVDTVERFQGQEKEIMILNLGDSVKEVVESQDENFINNPRRINVAVTRTKSRFYCLSSIHPNEINKKTEIVKFMEWTIGNTNFSNSNHCDIAKFSPPSSGESQKIKSKEFKDPA